MVSAARRLRDVLSVMDRRTAAAVVSYCTDENCSTMERAAEKHALSSQQLHYTLITHVYPLLGDGKPSKQRLGFIMGLMVGLND